MENGLAGVYNDFSGLSNLSLQAKVDPNKASHEVAEQFESIFVNMMLKAMRDAVPEGELFGSDQMSAYQDMFDQQLSLDLSRRGGIGLAAIIERQIAQSMPDPKGSDS